MPDSGSSRRAEIGGKFGLQGAQICFLPYDSKTAGLTEGAVHYNSGTVDLVVASGRLPEEPFYDPLQDVKRLLQFVF